ncbi:MAG: cell division protein FtsL [Gammaproteobacteria bacterium]|nr:cell division protein FtsL [Gammaproteobacteria bacterium]
MKYFLISLLSVTVFISALEVVITQHRARKLFVEIQEQEKIHDELNDLWGRLQLEQSTWATDDRIEFEAVSQMGMIEPGSKTLKVLIQ